MLDALKTRYTRCVVATVTASVRHAKVLLVLTTLLTGLMLYYTATHIAINTDTSEMLDPKLPHRQASKAYDLAFPNVAGELVMFVEAAHAGDAEDLADALAAEIRTHRDIVQAVFRPGGGEHFAQNGLLYLDPDALWALDQRLAEAEPFLGTLARDPSLRGLFATLEDGLDNIENADQQKLLVKLFDRLSATIEDLLAGKPGRVYWRDELFADEAGGQAMQNGVPKRAFILVKPTIKHSDFQPAEATLDLLNALKARTARDHPALRVRITGSVPMESEELVTVAHDAKLTTALSLGLVTLLLVWGLRAPGPVVAVFVALTFGLVWTAAFATLAIGSLNIISVCFAVLFIGMGVDFGIQFAMRYLEECDRGAAQDAALAAAAGGVGGALTLAAVGAAISFFAFVPTDYRGLAELGIISGFSMIVALAANLTVLPALLGLMRVPKPRHLEIVEGDHVTAAQAFIARHRRTVLAIAAVTVLASLVLLPRARFDFNPLNLKDPSTEAVAAFKSLAADPDSSPYTIEVIAADVAAAAALAARLETLPTVDKAVTLASYVPADQDEKLRIIDGMRLALGAVLEPGVAKPPSLAEQAAAVQAVRAHLAKAAPGLPSRLAASRVRLAAALDRLVAAPGWPDRRVPALEQRFLGDMPATLARLRQALEAAPVTLEGLPADLKARYVARDGRTRVEVFPKHDLANNHDLREFVRSVQAIAPDATDSPVELLEGSDTVIRACIQAAALALVLTIIMHIVVLHGIVDALLVAAPLVLAMIYTVATSVLLDFPFNFANIIALPLLIGLNNAYGAYLVIRGHSETDVGNLLKSSTPRAVLFSGLTAIASFGVLAVSKHPGMAGMGVLISLSLFFALLCALVVLPAIMAELEARKAASA